MTSANASKLDEAIIFATKAHVGETRKGSTMPYIVHPMEALAIAVSITDDEDVLCAAVLHDVVEDTEFTLDDIKVAFGERIAGLVAHMTEDKRRELPPEVTWKVRKEEALASHTKAPLEVKIIFLADRLSNLRSCYKDYQYLGRKLWQRFNMKDESLQEWYYRAVLDVCRELKDTIAYKEYEALLDRVFVNE